MSFSPDDIERMLRLAKKDTRTFKGYSPSTVEVDGKLVTGLERNQPGAKPGWAVPDITDAEMGLEPLTERTPRERSQGLAKRLWESAQENPAAMAILRGRMKTEKALAFEDVRELSVELIKQAELDQKD